MRTDARNYAVGVPSTIVDKKTGEVLEGDAYVAVLDQLLVDARNITDMAEWEITDENRIAVQGMTGTANRVGTTIGIRALDQFSQKGAPGASRVHDLVAGAAVKQLRSWQGRIDAAAGTRRASAGWKRTARATRPSNLSPRLQLGDAGSQYCRVSFADPQTLTLDIVVGGHWYVMEFPFPYSRFRDFDKVGLPTVTFPDGRVRFDFAVQWVKQYPEISSRYVVGVDVGIAQYASVVVYDLVENRIVETTTLSRRVHSLSNKVKSANIQVRALQRKSRPRWQVAPHREANSRRKRELAIIAAQEVADLVFRYQAAVAVEDLSWIRNTMKNGRWNRGEFIRRLEEFVELNGSHVMRVSAYNTSQTCHCCGERIIHNAALRTVRCPSCRMIDDRDLNAAANIARRAGDRVVKASATRAKKAKGRKAVRRSNGGSGEPLRFPGRDRTKTGPTPRRPKEAKKRSMCSPAATVAGRPQTETSKRAAGRGVSRLLTRKAARDIPAQATEVVAEVTYQLIE